MNLKTIKALNEAALEGVTVDWVKEDTSVREVSIRDAKGAVLIIRASNSYGEALKLLVPKPFDEVDRWALEGNFLGLTQVAEIFETEHEAKGRLSSFESKAGYGSDTGLTIIKKRVRVNDAGETVANDTDIPF